MLIKASANGKLEDTIRSEGGIDSLVWDGESQEIGVIIETDYSYKYSPDFYELILKRLGKRGSYEIHEVLTRNEFVDSSLDEDEKGEYFRRESNSVELLVTGLFGDLELKQLSLTNETLLSFIKSPYVRGS
ncbi:SMC domain protein, partial [Candidatus Magnetobacterium bavaricum]